MTQHATTQSPHALGSSRLLPSLTAGLVAGVLTIIVQVSLAALIFSHDLSGYVPGGIGLTLFGALTVGVVTALTTSAPGTVAMPQEAPAAILAVIATAVVGSMPASATSEATFSTIVAAIAITSLLTGVFFLALGIFRLGDLIRYVPYPVVGGFLAGTDWLLIQGAFEVMADASLSPSHMPHLLQSDMLIRWLPGLILGVLLVVVLRRYKHFLIIPTTLLAAIGVFYLLAWLAGISVTEAHHAHRWLLASPPAGGLWQPLSLSALGEVDWSVILGQAGNVGTILVVSVVSLLLNASGLDLTVSEDVDFNRELRSAGLANLAAGVGGGPVGYHSLGLTEIGHEMGAGTRLVGLFCAFLCGLVLFLGGPLVHLFPKPVLGGLLLFLGLSSLAEWVYDAWFELPKADYVIVILIVVTIATFGILEGVGLGVALAVVLFVVNYSNISVVKHAVSGTSYRSNVDRPRSARRLLREKGDRLYVLELQGFIFFGTAHRLVDRIRERIDDSNLPTPRFIVMDFRQVIGLDTSAVLSFAKMAQLVEEEDIVLVFTHLAPEMERQLQREVFEGEETAAWHVCPDLDHGLEWCEEQVLRVAGATGITAEPGIARYHLEDFLPASDELAASFESRGEERAEGSPHPVPPPRGEGMGSAGADRILEYVERREVDEGYYLIRQGDLPKGIYFIAEGGATAQLAYGDGEIARLRRMGAGTVVGEISLYAGSQATASVVIDQPSLIYYLSGERLRQMEEADPTAAAAFHRLIAQILSERLVDATDTIRALLR